MLRVASLCSGYGGLDMAVREVLGETELVFVADPDLACRKLLEYRYPGVPNVGDIREAGWREVMRGKQPIDILTAGFPCQDVSKAGKKSGLLKGNRTGLWHQIVRAICELGPRFVFLENTDGLLSAPSDSYVEPCQECLGDGGEAPVLRAFHCVLSDLSEMGYDAEWGCVRASDAGAPHRRERVFAFGWARQDGREPGLDRHRGYPAAA